MQLATAPRTRLHCKVTTGSTKSTTATSQVNKLMELIMRIRTSDPVLAILRSCGPLAKAAWTPGPFEADGGNRLAVDDELADWA
jgi:hypothetical protein